MQAEASADSVASNIISVRYLFTVTLLVVAEAGVWTQMSYLPHGLLKTTTVLAVLSFLALTFEPAIRAHSRHLARITWIPYVSLAGIVIYGFFGDLHVCPLTQQFVQQLSM